jgi:predicted amidohydrolase YtcJ
MPRPWPAKARTQVIDLKQRTVIPGLNDSHLHLIRGGLNYNLELRWEGVPSLADALRMLKDQAAARRPAMGARGRRLERIPVRRKTHADPGRTQPGRARYPGVPAAPVRPRLLNRAALQAVGYTKDTPEPAGRRDRARQVRQPDRHADRPPNAMILYATLAKGPKLPLEYQVNSTRQFMRELNRLGLTSAIDAGGGFQNYPDDYRSSSSWPTTTS